MGLNLKLQQGVDSTENAIEEAKQEQTARESRKPPYTDEQMDEALKTVYRTGKQIDGANYLNINKGTFNKKIREIEEKEPERVKRLKAEVEAERREKLLQEYEESVSAIPNNRTEKTFEMLLEYATKEELEIMQGGNGSESDWDKILKELIKRKSESITQAPQKPETAPEPHEPIKSTPSEEKAEEKPNTKQEKRVMGFRADVNKIDLWKIYAEATEQEIGVMCTAAIDEYISNHELTADQRQIFDIKIKALEAEKRIKAKNR
ncbi:MAG: hypothetical protein OSJ73_13390 [Lachnospiraceae bacterium]|nr:hypothetical protein [Lachnospiraceae bacterium]